MPSPKGLDACLGSAESTSLFLMVQEHLAAGTGSQWCGRRAPHTEVGPGLWGSPDSSCPDPPALIPPHGCAHTPPSELQQQYHCIPATNPFLPRELAFGFPLSPSADTPRGPGVSPFQQCQALGTSSAKAASAEQC